jgi:hypothetical protein
MKLQEKMFAMVESWEASGMKKVKFLSDKSIGLSKFDYWLNKYRNQHKKNQSQLPVAMSSESFKSFVLSKQSQDSASQSVSMEIDTPSGVRITLYH